MLTSVTGIKIYIVALITLLNFRVMAKIILLSLSSIAGLLIVMLWEPASHGHLQLRVDKVEDWIVLTLLIILFGLPLYYLLTYLSTLKNVDSSNFSRY